VEKESVVMNGVTEGRIKENLVNTRGERWSRGTPEKEGGNG